MSRCLKTAHDRIGGRVKAKRRLLVSAQLSGLQRAISVIENVESRGCESTSSLQGLSATFLRQSFRSDYCGVYATAMLVAALGSPVSRSKALQLFGLYGRRERAGFDGTSHEQMREVLLSETGVRRAEWTLDTEFSFNRVCEALRTHVLRAHCPTIITFGAIHRRLGVSCCHAALVTHFDESRIRLLDPLGGSPGVDGFNVTLERSGAAPEDVLTHCATHAVVPAMPSAVLSWER